MKGGVALRAAEVVVGEQDLPEEVRPRERLLAGGAAQLSALELVALVIGSAGLLPARVAAERILARHGSLPELSRVTPTELARVLGDARGARLAAALELGRRAS